MPRRNKRIKHIVSSLQTACLTKRRFANEHAARTAAENQMLMNVSLSLNVYRCDYCTGWHLTSILKNLPKNR